MATTVSEGRVCALLGSEPGSAEFWAYSTAAVAVVDARLSSLSEALRSLIAEHLTASYFELAASGAGLKSKRIGDASWAWSDDAVKDLRATRNGRIAVELDTTGALGEASKPKPAFAVL